jgi:hypothetical protein
MLRASNDPASPYYAAFVTPGHGVAVQWRGVQGGTTSQFLVPGAVPAYLMVARYTTSGPNPIAYYTAYTSADGINWNAIPGSTNPLNITGPLQAGFAITSHNQGAGSAVTLDSVAVTAAELQPPGICPSGWLCADIGGATPAGGQNVINQSWTVQGGGGDIWDVADSFRFSWQSLAANGTVSAQVNSQTATDPWAKGGLMLRASTDPGSPYYAAFVTPSNGIAIQWRSAQGAMSNQVLNPGTTPIYLQITRTGTTYTAATSADGVTWTPLANSGVSLPSLTGAVLAGLAVTSHNTAALSTVVFNSTTVTPA